MKTNLHWQKSYFNNATVENRILSLKPKMGGERLVFVPNWRAKEKHWYNFIAQLAAHYKVDYFESREKVTTRFKEEKLEFTIEKMGEDLANYLNQIQEPYRLIGVSIGANSIIKAWKQLKKPPQSLVLICPILDLKMPFYFRFFKYIPNQTVRFLRPAIFFSLKNSKQLRNVSKGLYKAFKDENLTELLLVKASIQDLLKMRMCISEVKQINCPSFIIGTKNDRIHFSRDASAISKNIPVLERYETFDNFRAIHEQACADTILKWYHTPYLKPKSTSNLTRY